MLEELQSLDETTKKRVIVIATIIIMVIVLGIWIAYFNSIIVGTPAPQPAAASSTTPVAAAPAPILTITATSTPTASGPGFWGDIKNFFGSIANIFQRPSQYNIQPQNN